MVTASRRLIASIDEFDSLARATPNSSMILRPGRIRGELTRVDLGEIVVETLDYSFPVAALSVVVCGWAGFVTPLCDHTDARVNGELLVPHVLHAYGSSTEVSTWSPEQFQCGVMSFREHALSRHAERLGIDIKVPTRGEFRLAPTDEWGRLRDLFDEAKAMARRFDNMVCSPLDAPAMQDAFIQIAVRSFASEAQPERRPRRTRRNYAQIVRACDDYAARVRYQGVTPADLCAASGVPERRVRHAFSECFGMSPSAYLRIAALYRVHRALLVDTSTPDPVTRAATEYGFWHLGRFAGQYRALFGESPSATVTRVAASRPRARPQAVAMSACARM